MKAIWNNHTVAEAPQEKLIRIEGNWYFPPDSLKSDYFTASSSHTTCFWKGQASYYNLKDDDTQSKDAAWYYPEPQAGSTEKVGRDYSDYVAFSPIVQVSQ